jgi:DNA-directed RNA polymerase subunit L
MAQARISALRNDPNDSNILLFTLTDVNVSIANALRRILLCEIKVPCFKSEYLDEDYKCTIEGNTTRFTNEVIKQRLACVPIHITDDKINVENYEMVLDVKNTTKDVLYVTTKYFKLKNKKTGKLIKDESSVKIFPPNEATGDFIEFLRLMPAPSSTHDGEYIKLSCPLTYGIAKESGCFTAVSLAAYGNTIDEAKAALAWETKEKGLVEVGELDDEHLLLEKKNWYLLEGKRHFKPNSFDFKVKSVGVFQNEDLLNKAVAVLVSKLDLTESSLKSGDNAVVEIKKSKTNIPHSYDIVLHGEDYTLGKILEYYTYEQYYEKQKTLSFVGFRKEHPSDTKSILRLSFNENMPKEEIIRIISNVCGYVKSLIENIKF